MIQNLDSATDRPRRHVGALESKARVDKQIAAIREVLFAAKYSLAERYLEDLVSFQLGQGDREHAAMSLSALTAIALDANQFEMADRLSSYALRLTSDDRVVYTSRAEVFKRRGHFDAALKAYEEAIERFRGDRWSLNGYADVLKEKGLFAESIARYKQTQREFPDDPVAFNGEVSVLKASGERRAAASLAVKYAKRFEYDSVTRSTLAGCLASLGKYDEAIRQFSVAIELNFSEIKIHMGYVNALRESGNLDAALRHTDAFLLKFPREYRMIQLKASLLRSGGRLDDAESLFTRLIELYPTYAPAVTGLAATRILQQRAAESRVTLPEDGMESELDWYGFRLRALSYASVGDYQDAALPLAYSLKECPWARERSKVETALGFVELHRGDYSKSITLLNKGLAKLEMSDQQLRVMLLGHAHALRGAIDVASILLGGMFSSKDATMRTTRNALVNEYGIAAGRSESESLEPWQIRTSELSLAMAA